jgi:DNA polymerase III alpha subunit (gram-positive type)
MIHPNDFFVIDCETGGLKPTETALAEIAICVIDWDLNDVITYNKIIAPYDRKLKYEESALRVNKLTMADIRKGKDSYEVIDDIIRLFEQSKNRTKKKPVLCGHNFENFDIPFIEAFFKHHKKDLWKYVERYCIDTMWWARWRHKESENFKLGTIVGKEDIYISDSHTALGDTESTKELVKLYLKALRGDGNKAEGTTQERRFRTTFQF